MISRERQEMSPLGPQPLGIVPDPRGVDLYNEFVQNDHVASNGELYRNEFDDVYGLLLDREVTNPTIRQCAVAALTAPQGQELPYEHCDLWPSVERLLRVADSQSTGTLRQQMRHNPEVAEELSSGILYWLDVTNGEVKDAQDYLRVIRQLVPTVSEETADKLMAYYPLDKGAVELLSDRQFPRKYKDASLAMLLETAEKEVPNKRKAFEGSRARNDMASLVEGQYDRVEEDIYNSVVSFLENTTPQDSVYLSHCPNASRIVSHIADDELRFAFAVRHVFADAAVWDRFYIYDEKSHELTAWIKEEAHKRGLPAFVQKAAVLLQDYEARCEEQQRRKVAAIALRQTLREA